MIVKNFEFQFADDDRSSITERAGSIYDPMRTSFSNTTTVLENLQSQIKLKEGMCVHCSRFVLLSRFILKLLPCTLRRSASVAMGIIAKRSREGSDDN